MPEIKRIKFALDDLIKPQIWLNHNNRSAFDQMGKSVQPRRSRLSFPKQAATPPFNQEGGRRSPVLNCQEPKTTLSPRPSGLAFQLINGALCAGGTRLARELATLGRAEPSREGTEGQSPSGIKHRDASPKLMRDK